MRNARAISIVKVSAGAVASLVVLYVALVTLVVTYASLTVGFSQSIKTDQSALAALESQYLDKVAEITTVNYAAAGYATPTAKRFVPERSVTALR